jgi:hypothetical protein
MDLTGKDTFKEKRGMLLLFFIVVISVGVYQFLLRKRISTEGVYSKCIVIKSEGFKGGILTTVRYSYKGKAYEGGIHSEKGREKAGDAYFIKILPEKPDAVVFLEDNPVPDCLLAIQVPPEGWKELPICK